MKKELKEISKYDADEFMTLVSLNQSYESLIKIFLKKEIGYELINIQEVKKKQKEIRIKIEKWWEIISNKYGFPMYDIEKMFVDFNECKIYVRV